MFIQEKVGDEWKNVWMEIKDFKCRRCIEQKAPIEATRYGVDIGEGFLDRHKSKYFDPAWGTYNVDYSEAGLQHLKNLLGEQWVPTTFVASSSAGGAGASRPGFYIPPGISSPVYTPQL